MFYSKDRLSNTWKLKLVDVDFFTFSVLYTPYIIILLNFKMLNIFMYMNAFFKKGKYVF